MKIPEIQLLLLLFCIVTSHLIQNLIYSIQITLSSSSVQICRHLMSFCTIPHQKKDVK